MAMLRQGVGGLLTHKNKEFSTGDAAARASVRHPCPGPPGLLRELNQRTPRLTAAFAIHVVCAARPLPPRASCHPHRLMTRTSCSDMCHQVCYYGPRFPFAIPGHVGEVCPGRGDQAEIRRRTVQFTFPTSSLASWRWNGGACGGGRDGGKNAGPLLPLVDLGEEATVLAGGGGIRDGPPPGRNAANTGSTDRCRAASRGLLPRRLPTS